MKEIQSDRKKGKNKVLHCQRRYERGFDYLNVFI